MVDLFEPLILSETRLYAVGSCRSRSHVDERAGAKLLHQQGVHSPALVGAGMGVIEELSGRRGISLDDVQEARSEAEQQANELLN